MAYPHTVSVQAQCKRSLHWTGLKGLDALKQPRVSAAEAQGLPRRADSCTASFKVPPVTMRGSEQ